MDKMQREHLLKKITVMDFMATDLHLYLNTHPQDKEAIKMYNDVVRQSAQAKKEYESVVGPLVGFRSEEQTESWRWEDCPWPWETDFNFKWDTAAVHHREER